MTLQSQPSALPGDWGEDASRVFIDYGRYFVPDRERQLATLCALVPPSDEPFNILELGCGPGLLARSLLEQFPQATVYGYDGSPAMLDHARRELMHYGDRFQTAQFDLAAPDWRRPPWPVRAVVSSLVIHHLDAPQKQQLFRDMHSMLQPGGALLIADLVEAANPLAADVAAKAWDAAVMEQAQSIDGHLAAFEVFQREQWNMYRYFDPGDIDKPSRLVDQLTWLTQAGFAQVDVVWMRAGHAIFGGWKAG